MNTPTLPPIAGRIVVLSGSEAVRLIRCDADSISFDRGTVATIDGEPVFTCLFPAQGVGPLPGFDPATAEAWPTDADLAAHIANPPAPAIPVPAEVPMWAIRAVLDLQGLTAQITAILHALPEPDRTVVNRVWEYGNFIRRASPVIASLTAALEKTESEVDAFFIQAAALNP
jgi:hypothetical protein